MVRWFYFIEKDGINVMVPFKDATIAKRMTLSDDGKLTETRYFDIKDLDKREHQILEEKKDVK